MEKSVFHKKKLIPLSLSSSSSLLSSPSLSLSSIGISYDEIVVEKSTIKCYCISDLHADSERNQEWVKDKCIRHEDDKDVFTVLIIPGDIGSDIDKIIRVFKNVADNYDIISYIPGNHECWKRGSLKSTTKECKNSIEKFHEVMECAKENNIKIGPIRLSFKEKQQNGLCIFPLYSWYHSGFDTEPDLQHPDYLHAEKVFPFIDKWGDFKMCSFDPLVKQHEFSTIKIEEDNTTLAQAFADLNEPFLQDETIVQDNDTIISFSHFVPRQELTPEKKFLLEPLLTRVIGSVILEKQIRRLGPNLHIFGHTHIPIDLELEGIRYLQWPLGYFREAEMQCKDIVKNGPLLVFDSSMINGIYCEESKEMTWSKYYKENNRNPTTVDELSPWLQAKLNNFL